MSSVIITKEQYLNLHKTLVNLLGNPGNGSLKKIIVLPSGYKFEHCFSWATGMGCQFDESNYRKIFNEIPEWIQYCHPYHCRQLFKLAIDEKECLPNSVIKVTHYIQKLLNLKRINNKKKLNNLKFGKNTLEETLKTLYKSEKLLKILHKEFGSLKASIMINIMKKGKFSGDLGNDLHDYILDKILNNSRIVWKGLTQGDDDRFPIYIKRFHGIYYISALEFDNEGYFLDLNSAKSFMYSNFLTIVK